MDFFDNAINKAKEAIEIVSQKTEEVVSNQKNKFDIASIKNKRSKDFEKLGELYFDLVKDTEIENEEIKNLVENIIDKNNKIEEAQKEINSTLNKKVCSNCNELAGKNALFCSKCGNKFE